VIILSKILIIVSVTALLRCSEKFRKASRAFDEHAIASLKQVMNATEDLGYPPQLAPLLILITALCFMFAGMH
jgi:hypothetical protein